MAALTIGQRIKKARQKSNISQLELANRMGKPYQSISQWERDIASPKYDSLEAIAGALGISVVDLIRDDDDSDNKDEPQKATSHPASAPAQPSPDFLQALLNEIVRCVRDNTEASAVDVYQTWISSIHPIVQKVFDKAIQKLESDAEASHSESSRMTAMKPEENHSEPDMESDTMQRINRTVTGVVDALIKLASSQANPEEQLFLTPDDLHRLADMASDPIIEEQLIALGAVLRLRDEILRRAKAKQIDL